MRNLLAIDGASAIRLSVLRLAPVSACGIAGTVAGSQSLRVVNLKDASLQFRRNFGDSRRMRLPISAASALRIARRQLSLRSAAFGAGMRLSGRAVAAGFAAADGNGKSDGWTRATGAAAAAIAAAAIAAAGAGASCALAEKEERLFTMEEIQRKEGGRIYVTHGDDVFDVTDFVSVHPGGNKILLAAGSALEPFWQLYTVHNNEEVHKLLQEMRVGKLKPGEREKARKASADLSDAFANEPPRHPALRPASERPFNAEPPAELLADSFHTPNDLFFVRNHLGVPAVDANKYELAVQGPGLRRPLKLKLADLKKYPKHTIDATLQCAGNRRSEMMDVKPVKGLRWGHAAISTASWSGARLVDVLRDAGIDFAELERQGIRHVQFEGLDRDESNFYGASVPIELALNPLNDVILAYEMNGVELPADHGFPVRVIVPGTAGARNVKWLCKVELSTEESRSHWQRNDYKGFNASIDWHNVNFEKAESIQEMPITSAICTPSPNEVIEADEDGMITLKGYAWSGGGRGVIRVDVSLDGGATWHEAELRKPNQPRNRTWAWTQWQARLKVDGLDAAPNNSRQLQLVCKAVDSSYNAQPERFESIWNMRGLLSNAWHRVPVTVKKQ